MDTFVVVGMGSIGKRHIRNLRKLYPNSKIYAVSSSGRNDELPECADSIIGIHEIEKYRPKFVVVASPAVYHAEHSVPLIDVGIPVLIEKPISTDLYEIEKIINSEKKYNTPVAVGYCLRFLPAFKLFRELLLDKCVGNIHNVFIEVGQYLPDWRLDKDYKDSVSVSPTLGGGALFELSHELDYCLNLFGEIDIVSAVLRSSSEFNLDVEDSADILGLNNSAVVLIHLDFLQREPFRRCRVIGVDGVLELDFIGNKITLSNNIGKKVLYSDPHLDRNVMYLNMLRDFALSIDGFEAEPVRTCEAKKVVQLIHKINQVNSSTLSL